MKQYKIKKDSLEELRKEMMIDSIPILLIVLLFGVLGTNHCYSEEGLKIYSYIIPIITLGGLLHIYRGTIRNGELLDSYRLTLENGTIIREQKNTPTITITKDEIKEIGKEEDGSLVIKGNLSVNIIDVPRQLEEYKSFKQKLSEIGEISETVEETFWEKNE